MNNLAQRSIDLNKTPSAIPVPDLLECVNGLVKTRRNNNLNKKVASEYLFAVQGKVRDEMLPTLILRFRAKSSKEIFCLLLRIFSSQTHALPLEKKSSLNFSILLVLKLIAINTVNVGCHNNVSADWRTGKLECSLEVFQCLSLVKSFLLSSFYLAHAAWHDERSIETEHTAKNQYEAMY